MHRRVWQLVPHCILRRQGNSPSPLHQPSEQTRHAVVSRLYYLSERLWRIFSSFLFIPLFSAVLFNSLYLSISIPYITSYLIYTTLSPPVFPHLSLSLFPILRAGETEYGGICPLTTTWSCCGVHRLLWVRVNCECTLSRLRGLVRHSGCWQSPPPHFPHTMFCVLH